MARKRSVDLLERKSKCRHGKRGGRGTEREVLGSPRLERSRPKGSQILPRSLGFDRILGGWCPEGLVRACCCCGQCCCCCCRRHDGWRSRPRRRPTACGLDGAKVLATAGTVGASVTASDQQPCHNTALMKSVWASRGLAEQITGLPSLETNEATGARRIVLLPCGQAGRTAEVVVVVAVVVCTRFQILVKVGTKGRGSLS
jgi:hypothetical protein